MTTKATPMMQTTTGKPSYMEKFSDLGISSGFSKKDFDKTFIIIAAPSGNGKSNLLEGDEHLLRIELDRAGTSNPGSRCQNLPGLDYTGDVDWNYVKTVVDRLVELAAANKPRPRAIAFDTIDRLTDMLCVQVAKEQNVETFADMDGRRAWGIVYDRIMGLLDRIRRVGYGIRLVTYLTESSIPNVDGTGATKIKWDYSMKPGLYARTKPLCDMLFAIHKRDLPAKKVPVSQAPKELVTPGMKGMVEVEPARKEFLAIFEKCTDINIPFRGVSKERVDMPDMLVLPREGGWDALRIAYEQADSQHISKEND